MIVIWSWLHASASGKSRTSSQQLSSEFHYSQVYLHNFSIPVFKIIITPSHQPLLIHVLPTWYPTLSTCLIMLKCCSFLLKKSFRACCPAERSQLLGRGWCREAWCLWSEGPWGTHRPWYAPTQHLGSLFNGCLHIGCRGRGPWFTHNCGPAQIPRWGEHTVPPTPHPHQPPEEKGVKPSIFAKQKQRHRRREQTWTPRGEMGIGRIGRLRLTHIHHWHHI